MSITRATEVQADNEFHAEYPRFFFRDMCDDCNARRKVLSQNCSAAFVNGSDRDP